MKRSPSVRRRPATRTKIPKSIRQLVEQRSRGICEMDDCTAPATDLHHRLRRAQGGKHTVENLAHLCSHDHHVRIHGNPKWAYETGWLLRRTVET